MLGKIRRMILKCVWKANKAYTLKEKLMYFLCGEWIKKMSIFDSSHCYSVSTPSQLIAYFLLRWPLQEPIETIGNWDLYTVTHSPFLHSSLQIQWSTSLHQNTRIKSTRPTYNAPSLVTTRPFTQLNVYYLSVVPFRNDNEQLKGILWKLMEIKLIALCRQPIDFLGFERYYFYNLGS